MKYISLYVLTGLLILASCSKNAAPSASVKSGVKDDDVKYEYYFVEGLRNKLVGSPADAIALFEECIKIDAGRAGAWYQIGQILYIVGDLGRARGYSMKALALEKNIWHYMLAANILYKDGRIDSAAMIYEKALAEFPDSEEIRFTLGNLYFESEKYDLAAGAFNYFEKKYGLTDSSAIPYIKSLAKQGKFEEAMERLNLLISGHPEEIVFRSVMAEIYSERGESDKAGEIYQDMLKDDPANIKTIYSLIEYFRKEDNTKGIFEILNFVALNDAIPVEEKVSLFAAQLENREFVINYQKELEISTMILEAAYSGNQIVMLLRPEIMIITGRSEEAVSYYEDYLKKWPENYYPWEKLLMILADGKNYGKLYSTSALAVRRFNTAIIPRLLNAVAAVEEGLYDEALEQLGRLRRLINENEQLELQVLSVEADALYRKGSFEEAFNKFEEAIKLDSEDVVILNNYAYFLAEKDIRLRDAERMIEKVIKNEPSNNTFNDTYAWVLFKNGKLRKAEKVMRSIIESEDNQNAEYFEHYGFIMKKLRKCGQALISWNKALELDPARNYLQKEIENCERGR